MPKVRGPVTGFKYRILTDKDIFKPDFKSRELLKDQRNPDGTFSDSLPEGITKNNPIMHRPSISGIGFRENAGLKQDKKDSGNYIVVAFIIFMFYNESKYG